MCVYTYIYIYIYICICICIYIYTYIYIYSGRRPVSLDLSSDTPGFQIDYYTFYIEDMIVNRLSLCPRSGLVICTVGTSPI